MNNLKKKDFIFENVSILKGVGKKLTQYLLNKKINTLNDLIWNFPYSSTDRSNLVELDKLEIGKILTIKVKVVKYYFPRIRNLPNKILCKDSKGSIDIVYFNSREGYLRKIFPLNQWVIISGKIHYFKKKYQITNPEYVTNTDNEEYIKKIIPKYSLTDGLTEKSYRKIIEQVINNLPDIDEWHDSDIIKNLSFPSWKKSIIEMHSIKKEIDFNSNFYKRLAFDEIISNLLVLSDNRRKIKKIIKQPKKIKNKLSKIIIQNLSFELTRSQKFVINEINKDQQSKSRMFRILQGDVGSGKTIVSLICCANTIEANFQCALMAPTEILAKQHFSLTKKVFKNLNISVALLTGKTEHKERKKILKNLEKGSIDLVIGTHSLFQKKVFFKKLGLIIIDEQHKFGVKQRMSLAKKGGNNCDVLVMSATPIPRTMMMSIYGDMDISKIDEKPLNRKNIITLSKPEEKINELWPYLEKELKSNNQIFWVCPLIDKSNFLDYSSAINKYETISKKFPKNVGLIHGALDKNEKEEVLQKFENREINILVSTTVIEVGVDFPNANIMIIENANKFGLAQLHQLRGRVGRGSRQGVCILLFKGNLNKKAIKRIKILKSSNDGFYIADEDMKLRGFGDVLGFQQSGDKFFKIADPVNHEKLFQISESYIKKIEQKSLSLKKFNFLLKLFDKAEILSNEEFI